MARLELWKDPWPLDVKQCPCDVHFTSYLKDKGLAAQTIFHFGTGDHHHVGLQAPANDHAVLGITATEPEYRSYIRLVTENPHLGKYYKVIFGDIYQINPRLLPVFDIITLFHLCEFWSEHNSDFSNFNDQGVLDALTNLVRPGGLLLFYKGSFAYDAASRLIPDWVEKNGFIEENGYETLRIFRKPAF